MPLFFLSSVFVISIIFFLAGSGVAGLSEYICTIVSQDVLCFISVQVLVLLRHRLISMTMAISR